MKKVSIFLMLFLLSSMVSAGADEPGTVKAAPANCPSILEIYKHAQANRPAVTKAEVQEREQELRSTMQESGLPPEEIELFFGQSTIKPILSSGLFQEAIRLALRNRGTPASNLNGALESVRALALAPEEMGAFIDSIMEFLPSQLPEFNFENTNVVQALRKKYNLSSTEYAEASKIINDRTEEGQRRLKAGVMWLLMNHDLQFSQQVQARQKWWRTVKEYIFGRPRPTHVLKALPQSTYDEVEEEVQEVDFSEVTVWKIEILPQEVQEMLKNIGLHAEDEVIASEYEGLIDHYHAEISPDQFVALTLAGIKLTRVMDEGDSLINIFEMIHNYSAAVRLSSDQLTIIKTSILSEIREFKDSEYVQAIHELVRGIKGKEEKAEKKRKKKKKNKQDLDEELEYISRDK